MKIELVEIAIGVFTVWLAFQPGTIYKGRLGGWRNPDDPGRKPVENQRAMRLITFALGLGEILDGGWRVFFK